VRRALVALVVGVALLEAILQVAALLAPLIGSPARTAAAPGTARILLVGDSHAAGAMVPADQRLSDHLEAMLAARHPGRAFEVVNLGRAGVNSAYVANRLEADIAEYRPQLVIVWVGVNDLWNPLETESWPTTDWRLRLRRVLLRSKVYRLLTVMWHTRGADGARGVPRVAARGEDLAPVAAGLAYDLERMTRTAFAQRTPILLVNYPVPYEGVNATIRTSGERLGVPVVKTDHDLWRAQEDGQPYGALITLAAGPHPTGVLYRYVAESAVPHVEMLLRQAGVDLPRAERTSDPRRGLGSEASDATGRPPQPSGSSP
jgi:lysophospholipase L1-like esterase